SNPNHYSFPTRRSSDLRAKRQLINNSFLIKKCCIISKGFRIYPNKSKTAFLGFARQTRSLPACLPACLPENNKYKLLILAAIYRSEEHTSELQSRFDLVCRLLLEKKDLI